MRPSRFKTHIESFSDQMRNADTKNINRGRWRVYGLVKTTFMSTFVVVATNLPLVRDWAKREGIFTDLPHEQPTEDFGFEELGPDGDVSLTPATFDLGPPDLAAPTPTRGPRGTNHVSWGFCTSTR